MKGSSKKLMKTTLETLLIITVFAGMVSAQPGQIENNIEASSPGVPYFEDFELEGEVWSADNGVWQVGNSTTIACHGGQNCTGTNLNGNYPPGTSSMFISPSIQLPSVNADEEIHLRFWQWFSYAGGDWGRVHVSFQNASTGIWGVWEAVGNNIASTSPYWSLADRELTQYAGKKIRIGFYHTADGYWGESTGWYIDDVEIIKSIPAFTGDFESGWNGWYGDRGVWQVGNSTTISCHGGQNCTGTNLNGNYPPGTSSMFISPSIQLPSVNADEEIHLRFWQWFSYAGGDWGRVHVSFQNASTGIWGVWEAVGNNIASTSPYWSLADRELTQYAGKKIRIGFDHTADGYWGESTGWYIDDIVVTNRRGDLNRNGIPADAGDLVLMKRASIGEIAADSRYDLNNNGQLADAGDLVLMKRASIGEINLEERNSL
jgi:hypothetical protein